MKCGNLLEGVSLDGLWYSFVRIVVYWITCVFLLNMWSYEGSEVFLLKMFCQQLVLTGTGGVQ